MNLGMDPVKRRVAKQLASVAMTAALISACQSPTAPAPSLNEAPEQYWVRANGTVRIGDSAIPGHMRARYSVAPSGELVLHHWIAWMDDVDLDVSFGWWPVSTEPLRCSTLKNLKPLRGEISGQTLTIFTGAQVQGFTFTSRDDAGGCGGEARQIEATSTHPMTGSHDPENNRFSLASTFEAEQDGNTFEISFSLAGRYINRPPRIELGFEPETPVLEDGCPGSQKGDPPVAIANTAEGLRLKLVSEAWDPDGNFLPQQRPKRPRVDLHLEQWALRQPGAWQFLGTGREIGPVLFPTGAVHEFALWVTDRHGAEARKRCRFRVEATQ